MSYHSEPRQKRGEAIEEVLPEAIEATATPEREPDSGVESAHQTEQPRMRVMRAGSPALQLGTLPVGLIAITAVVVLALFVVALALI